MKTGPSKGPFFGLNNKKKKQNLIFSQHLVSFFVYTLEIFRDGYIIMKGD